MLLALLVSLLAGLATSIGGLMVLNKKTLQRSYLAVALAFAAGAMLIISLFQIVPLPESCHLFGFWVFGWVFWRVCAGGVWEKGY